MDTKRSRITYLLVAGSLCLAAWAASAMPGLRRSPVKTLTPPDPPPPVETHNPPVVQVPTVRPRVEVVFALDTTGSMSGLIDGAKRKIWSIAHFIQSGQPQPEVRIGLVAYRDKGDDYVTRFYDLSDDLDKVFERLSSFEAAGGGDTPEHVSKALYDAIYRSSWTRDQSTLKLVYLVGDAPPHTDYNDGFDYRAIARHAHDEGIHINTIRCGGDRETQMVWNQISSAASGEYASIDQTGGVIAIATPYDDKLAELNSKLVTTAVGYGRAAGEVRAKVSASISMSKSAAADRAGYFGIAGGAVGGGGDLVKDWEAGKAAPAAMPATELPPEMQAMDAPAREAYVRNKHAERIKVTEEIKALAHRRAEYLRDKTKADSFDAKVESAVKDQAASVGLRY
jgi:Mg-chelatase subunit ChlD